MMTWMKLKFAIGAGLLAMLAGTAVTSAISNSSSDEKPTILEIAQKSHKIYAGLTSYRDDGMVQTSGAGTTSTTTFNIRMQRPNLYRVDWVQTGGSFTSTGSVWSDGTDNYFTMGTDKNPKTDQPQKMASMQGIAIARATAIARARSSMLIP